MMRVKTNRNKDIGGNDMIKYLMKENSFLRNELKQQRKLYTKLITNNTIAPVEVDEDSSCFTENTPIRSPIPLRTPSTPPIRNTPVTSNFTPMHITCTGGIQALKDQAESTPRRRLHAIPIRPGVSTYAEAVKQTTTSNRFASLQVQQNQEHVAEDLPDDHPASWSPLQQKTVSPIQTRRPNICETEKFVQNMCRPQISKSPQQETEGYKPEVTAIVSDSMTRSIPVRHMNSYLDNRTEVVKIHKYPAAHANQIRLYAQYTLQMDKPTQVIINAGSNDVSYDMWTEGGANPEIIAERVLDIARDARTAGTKNIFISGLMKRKGLQYAEIINEVNLRLREKCLIEDFYFLDNDNINLSDLCDGLHLNQWGNRKFIKNLLQCCHSYNPYLNAENEQ